MDESIDSHVGEKIIQLLRLQVNVEGVFMAYNTLLCMNIELYFEAATYHTTGQHLNEPGKRQS